MSRKSLERKLGRAGIDQVTKAVATAELQTSAQVAVVVREWTSPLGRFGLRVSAERVHKKAERLFVHQGFDKTEERNAVMLYISLAERVAVVLGDVGIDGHVTSSAWNDVVRTLTEAARTGRLVEGICSAVAATGELLAVHFPRKGSGTNELADGPVLA